MQTFVLHASIIKALGESGKLKLTADTTSLEFAISQYLSSHSLALSSMGDQFKALRGKLLAGGFLEAFRPVLNDFGPIYSLPPSPLPRQRAAHAAQIDRAHV